IATLPSSGAWHHLAATYDGTSLMSLYIDGQIAAQQITTGAMPVTADPLAIGNVPSGNILYQFDGLVDDIRIYGSGLAPSQIAQLYNIDAVGDGIPDWWRLLYFGYSSTTDATSCANCDADGDGLNNIAEYIAGTIPSNSESALRILSITRQPNGDVQISWQNVP